MADELGKIENAFSVSDICLNIKQCFNSPIFQYIEVYGEVSGFKYSGAHAYFTVKDKNAALQCVCFNAASKYNPKDGESVLLKGSLDFYVKGGRLSFQVYSITPLGKGLLFLEFEKLKKKLQDEGLFAEEHKKPIPKFPKNVLVVTSKTGAVIRDIVRTVRLKNPIIDIVVKDVRVQGESAAHEISEALKRVDILGYDVVIIARGGGSLEDLAPFYDEELVRTVYAMNTPVISAVGHETDVSLCDFVADKRAATPTAAGELVAYDYYKMLDDVKYYAGKLENETLKNFSRANARVQICFQKLKNFATNEYQRKLRRVERAVLNAKSLVLKKIDGGKNRVLTLDSRMKTAAENRVNLCSVRAEKATDALDKLSPVNTLKRGYFRLQAGDKTVQSVANFKAGDRFTAHGSDGFLTATVDSVTLNDKNDN